MSLLNLGLLSALVVLAASLGWLSGQWYQNSGQPATETVFVYGTLKSSFVRFYACRCHTATVPASLPGYRVEGLKLVPDTDAVADGQLLTVTPTELARFDRYERIPERYVRERVAVGGVHAWVYQRVE